MNEHSTEPTRYTQCYKTIAKQDGSVSVRILDGRHFIFECKSFLLRLFVEWHPQGSGWYEESLFLKFRFHESIESFLMLDLPLNFVLVRQQQGELFHQYHQPKANGFIALHTRNFTPSLDTWSIS